MKNQYKLDIIIAILIVISSTAYSALVAFNVDFKKVTAIYLSILLGLLPFYLKELGLIQIKRLIQNTNFFLHGFFEQYIHRNYVFKYSFEKILNIYEEMQKGTLTITNTEISKLIEIRADEEKTNNLIFLATIIITSDSDAKIWLDNKSDAYERISSYMNQQRKIVESGGIVKRIFIIKPWCNDIKEKVIELEKRYNEFFNESANAQARFVNFKTANLHELVETELNFINKDEVFEWIPNPYDKEKQLFVKGKYHYKNNKAEALKYSWDNLYENSTSAEEFIPIN